MLLFFMGNEVVLLLKTEKENCFAFLVSLKFESCISELQLKVNCRPKSALKENIWLDNLGIKNLILLEIHSQLQFACT